MAKADLELELTVHDLDVALEELEERVKNGDIKESELEDVVKDIVKENVTVEVPKKKKATKRKTKTKVEPKKDRFEVDEKGFVTCDKCGRKGKLQGMMKWHFDACKFVPLKDFKA